MIVMINECDMPKSREYVRDIIRSDIESAISAGITDFELVDDRYNYRYLAQYAREVANKIILAMAKRIAYDLAKADGVAVQVWRLRHECDKKKWAQVRSRKGNDRTHVYVHLSCFNLEDDVRAWYAEELNTQRGEQT